MSPERQKIQQLQLAKVKALLEAILPRNTFYARKLGNLNLAEIQSLEDFVARVPFTSKHELVKDRLEHPPYGSGLTFPLTDYSRCHQTSGSTAVPIRWLDTPASWDSLVDNWVRILQAAAITPEDRFFFAFSFGPFLGFWSAIEAVHRLNNFCFPGGGMSSVSRLQSILDNQITVLCCTPTYAQHLGEVAAHKQIDLRAGQVRLIIVAGEAGGSIPATRQRIETLWPGAHVFDHHGMTEVGPVTYQCPSKAGALHVLEHAYFAEVIDPSVETSVEPGVMGELVLTTLDRHGSPVLRYRTGDLVKAGPLTRCKCGRSELALAGGILGRVDDMVVVRGVNVYPSIVEEIIRSHPVVAEYRVHLDLRGSLPELAVDLELNPQTAPSESVADRIAESFQTALNLRVPVRTVPAGSLPRYEMKARRWVRVTEGVV